jgi:hypothetical protein
MTSAVMMDPLGSSSIHNHSNGGGHRSPTTSISSSSSPRGAGAAGIGRAGLSSSGLVVAAGEEAIPHGSLHSLRSLASRRRTELDTDLHSTSSHSRRSTRSAVRSVLSLHRTPSKTSLMHHHHHHPLKPGSGGVSGPPPPPHGYAPRGIVNYEDTDGESSSCDEDEDIHDFDGDDHSGGSSDDSCSTFAESTNDCVANSRYLRRGMSIEIGAACVLDGTADLSVSEFDDNIFNVGEEDDPHHALAFSGSIDELDELRAYEEMLRLTGGGGGGSNKPPSVEEEENQDKGDEAPPPPLEEDDDEAQQSPHLEGSPASPPSPPPPESPLVSPERAASPPPPPAQNLPEEDMAYFV